MTLKTTLIKKTHCYILWTDLPISVNCGRWYVLLDMVTKGSVPCSDKAIMVTIYAKKIFPCHHATTNLNVDTMHDRSILSCCLCQVLALPFEYRSRNRNSSDQVKFFQSFLVQFLWSLANCSPISCFYVTRMESNVSFYCCRRSAS